MELFHPVRWGRINHYLLKHMDLCYDLKSVITDEADESSRTIIVSHSEYLKSPPPPFTKGGSPRCPLFVKGGVHEIPLL